MIAFEKVIRFIIAHIDTGTIDTVFNQKNFVSAEKVYTLEPFGVVISEQLLDDIKSNPNHYAKVTGYQRVIKCKNCGGKCVPGRALNNPVCGSPEFCDGDMRGATLAPAADAMMVDCVKCEKCGHSFIN